uniref:Uncharacterized protein n=1 Tax=Amphimedon queenslandica TaxID=400682 RepID=A0A1X7TUR7_AMPQE
MRKKFKKISKLNLKNPKIFPRCQKKS